MIEIVFSIILILSLMGIGIILYRKMPLLLELPESSDTFDLKSAFLKTKESLPTEGLSSNLLLQRILSKVRVLTLKTDHKTSNWLQDLREKSKKGKFANENYWKDIKKKIK